jgi:hypothetical protein
MASLTFHNQEEVTEMLKNRSFEEFCIYMENEAKRRIDIITKTDQAFLNSILSFAVYDQNNWIFKKLKSDLSDMGSIFDDAIENKEKMYNLKVWHFMKNTFEKISDSELKIPPKGTLRSLYNYKIDYEFEDGQYSAADGLAHACILKSKDPKGTGDILHLSFRGTEFSKLFKYIKGPYLDMSAYYENFKPLVEYIRDYVNNPENNITEVHVNGHSLGGAMVQEFLKNNPPEKFAVPIKGFTFGSPGSEKKLYHKFATLAYHSLGRGVHLKNIYNNSAINDERMTQYHHNNDPIPLIGLLGYVKGGNNYALPDVAYKNDQDAKLEKPNFLEKVPAFGKLITLIKENLLNKLNTKFHDSKRYIINIRNYMENNYADPLFGNMYTLRNTPNWQNWRKHEKDFSTLSIKYKSAFEYLIKQQNPEADKDRINKQILEIRERMKCDSQANVVLSKSGKSHDQYDDATKDRTRKKTILYDENGAKNKNFKLTETVSNLTAIERIKIMKKLYQEKMEERALIFKKLN